MTLHAFCATQESPLLPPVVPPVGCFGLTATVVTSGLTHTVHLAATQLHDSLCVKNAVNFFMFMIYVCFSNIVV